MQGKPRFEKFCRHFQHVARRRRACCVQGARWVRARHGMTRFPKILSTDSARCAHAADTLRACFVHDASRLRARVGMPKLPTQGKAAQGMATQGKATQRKAFQGNATQRKVARQRNARQATRPRQDKYVKKQSVGCVASSSFGGKLNEKGGGGTNRSDAGLNLSGSWQQGHSATYNTPSRI